MHGWADLIPLLDPLKYNKPSISHAIGIDVLDEFQVLHWQQLMNARSYIFPQAMPYGDLHQTASLYAGDLADVELGTLEENVSQTGLGNDSESTRESARRETSKKSPVHLAHRKIFSLGDANLLANVKGGFDPGK